MAAGRENGGKFLPFRQAKWRVHACFVGKKYGTKMSHVCKLLARDHLNGNISCSKLCLWPQSQDGECPCGVPKVLANCLLHGLKWKGTRKVRKVHSELGILKEMNDRKKLSLVTLTHGRHHVGVVGRSKREAGGRMHGCRGWEHVARVVAQVMVMVVMAQWAHWSGKGCCAESRDLVVHRFAEVSVQHLRSLAAFLGLV